MPWRRTPDRPGGHAARDVTVVLAALVAAGVVACSDGDTGAPTLTAPSGVATSPAAASAAPPSTSTATTSIVTQTSASLTPSTSAEPPPPPTTRPADTGSGRYPSQPDDVPWPTITWPTGPLPAGIDRDLIDRTVDREFGAPDAAARLRAVVVVHGGRIVYERYHPLDPPTTVFESWSVAKSVTAALTGMLVDAGTLDVEAPAPVPEWQGPDDPRAAITLDDLLRMSSGLAWEEAYVPGALPLEMLAAPHAAAVPIAQPLVDEPGEVWSYSTGTSAIIADVLADTLGGPDELDTLIRERLMAPLGMRSTVVREDATGTFVGGVGFDSTARDFARFGLLHLRGGAWDGTRLLSERWIDYVRTPTPHNPRYGAHWWLLGGPDTFSAQGLFGQQIVVDVAHDLVIVTTASAGGQSFPVTEVLLDEFASLTP